MIHNNSKLQSHYTPGLILYNAFQLFKNFFRFYWKNCLCYLIKTEMECWSKTSGLNSSKHAWRKLYSVYISTLYTMHSFIHLLFIYLFYFLLLFKFLLPAVFLIVFFHLLYRMSDKFFIPSPEFIEMSRTSMQYVTRCKKIINLSKQLLFYLSFSLFSLSRLNQQWQRDRLYRSTWECGLCIMWRKTHWFRHL